MRLKRQLTDILYELLSVYPLWIIVYPFENLVSCHILYFSEYHNSKNPNMSILHDFVASDKEGFESSGIKLSFHQGGRYFQLD